MELTAKNLKEAENLPPTDTTDDELEGMMRSAKSGQESDPKLQHKQLNEKSSPYSYTKRTRLNMNKHVIQNRDSINWDAASDSGDDENSTDQDEHEFVDVTEAPLSAFSVVQPQTNGQIGKNESNFTSVIPNGKVYTAPPSTDKKSFELQQQCQKLQQLQRDHLRSPINQPTSVPVNTPTSPSIQPVPGILNRSYNTTPVSTRCHASSSGRKPVIAPKPQLIPEKNIEFPSDNKLATGLFPENDIKSTTV